MASKVTLIGNTTDDVELRYTQSGKAVGSVTIAVADRKFNRQTNQFEDGDTWFARCTIWESLGERAAQSIPKGTRVIAEGKVVQRSFEDRDGNKRTSVEVVVDEIGPSVKYATAVVTKAQRDGGQAGAGQAQNGSANSGQGQGGWAAPGASGGPSGNSGGFDDEPPF